MDKNMDQPQLILFNVDKGRLVDYMPCRDDRECGTYLLRQAELALEGSYVPAENIYGLDGRIESGTDIPGLLEDRIRDRGSLTDLFFFRLKDVTFLYEISAGRLPESMADTLFAVEERMLYPQNRKIQEEYDLYHTKMEQDIKTVPSRVSVPNWVSLFSMIRAGGCETGNDISDILQTIISTRNSRGWKN